MQKTLIYGEGFVRVEDMMTLIIELRHHKYKRCLDKAEICELDMEQWVEGSLRWKRRKNWQKRWLELAEKFKEDV